ncbi:MAG: hypothetical protein JSV95_06300 [Gemmatimonadota bacterium]|nr:MAG: hypothetical protein JSV95_06300 [Gemmatimonadota bacterium]
MTIDLDVGEVYVISDPDSLAEFELPGAAAAREYGLALQSATPAAGSLPFSFTGRAGASASAGVRASYAYSAPTGGAVQELLLDERDGRGSFVERQRSWLATVRLQQRAWAELDRIGARIAQPGAGRVARTAAARAETGAGADLRAASVPVPGEEVEFFIPIDEDLNIACDSTNRVVQAEVRSVGERFIIARDTQGADPFTDQIYAQLQAMLDDHIHRVGTAYFGETADLDANERVIVLITEEVNKLEDPTGSLIFLGFFLPTDLYSPADCAASNVAEIVYLRAPDPNGDFGRETSVESAIEILESTTAHEFQHLINAEQRFVIGNEQIARNEEIWLNEGLSHLAEEVVGLSVMGEPVRANLGIDEILANRDAFNTFLIDNFFHLGSTAQSDEGCDGWMIDPENSVGIISFDPPGCGSLTMRGWSYLFVRWLGDQEGPAGSGAIPGSNEQLFFRELARGGPSHLAGRANVEQAVATFGSGASWEELMADFLLMPAVDDQPGPSLPERSQLLTWDLRDLYRGLHENTGTSPAFPQPYPLKQQIILFSDVDFDFSVRGSSAKYFSLLATTTAPAYVIRVTDQAGEPLARTRSPQLTIVRLR